MSVAHFANARHRVARAAAILGVAVLAACAGNTDDAGSADSAGLAADTAATMSGAAADTGMAGMDHSAMDPAAMANMNRSPARDSTQTFLRMMSDHHEGLIAMADSAEERAQDATTKADAQQLLEQQMEEQQRMLTMLRQQYGDTITPTMMPSNRAMLDSLMRTSGAEFDRLFYHHVIAHHREGIQMMEQYIPQLTPEVRQMAEQMRTEQQREIQEFERKMGQVGGR